MYLLEKFYNIIFTELPGSVAITLNKVLTRVLCTKKTRVKIPRLIRYLWPYLVISKGIMTKTSVKRTAVMNQGICMLASMMKLDMAMFEDSLSLFNRDDISVTVKSISVDLNSFRNVNCT